MRAEQRPADVGVPGSAYGKLLSCIEGKHKDCPGILPTMLTDEPDEQACTCRCHRGVAVSPRERRVTEAVKCEPPDLVEGRSSNAG